MNVCRRRQSDAVSAATDLDHAPYAQSFLKIGSNRGTFRARRGKNTMDCWNMLGATAACRASHCNISRRRRF